MGRMLQGLAVRGLGVELAVVHLVATVIAFGKVLLPTVDQTWILTVR